MESALINNNKGETPMPRLRTHLSLAPYLLVVALVFFCTSTLLAQPVAKPPKTVTWTLTQGTVVDFGQTTTAPDGSTLVTGYTVQATAQSQGKARVRTGKFTIKCTIQEKAGQYQLRGAWDITREGSPKTTHHTPHSIKGTLGADLSFNPAANGTGDINGIVGVSAKRRHAGKEVKAQGTFSGNQNFEGTLTITRGK
jgi:hypothetical protein